MEHYVISINGIDKIDSLTDKLIEGGLPRFTLSLFNSAEWSNLAEHLARLPDTDDINHTLDGLPSLLQCTDYRFERLNPSLFLVRYSDFDSNNKEEDIQLFLTRHNITMLKNDWIDIERIADWARRDLLRTPSDLAQLLGMTILDHHQEQLEMLEEEMNQIEEDIMENPHRRQRSQIIQLHKKILGFKKSLNAHGTIFRRLSAMDRYDNGTPSWQDLVAETQQKLENARQTHELIEVLLETYQQANDNRANDIMKVLTLLATILLPINLLTSFFGMNFQHMPLAHSTYALPVFYLISVMIIGAVLILFWKKHWLR
ncbi:magnesium transporter [Dehalobacter sp. DCM]|uniref:magnesium transporter CorA family protein n=1 Tax=Dehalobacter sp. DCM TaxID=2907827 RepID=UPI0030816CA6|nr:magnesium transporter [Dehalobacter sp. DCM]